MLVAHGVRVLSSVGLGSAGSDETELSVLRSPPLAQLVQWMDRESDSFFASALAGFVCDRYVFATLQNGDPVPALRARRAQDRFATLLAARAD
jgi:D-alanyl-D-alanine carboxypeptidase